MARDLDWNAPLTSRHKVIGKGATVRRSVEMSSAKVGRPLAPGTVVVAAERRQLNAPYVLAALRALIDAGDHGAALDLSFALD